jgi:16S rRNA (cytosine967-C5)-methyltransferase
VCSVLREEGEDVVDSVLARATWLRAAPFAGEPAKKLAGSSHHFRLLPHVHGTDGYFMASFERLPT